jgi:phosphohistidine phosphatase
MQLYLVRHGIAAEGGEQVPDGSRVLTGKGRRRFQKTARAFARLKRRLDLILTSPLVRAVQTAEILACAADHGEVGVLEELDPKADVQALRAAMEKRAGKSRSVALVGHEPQLSSFLALLTGMKAADFDFKKGAIVRLDVDKEVIPRWWLKPRGAERVKGLPLAKQAQKKAAAPADKKRKAKKSRSSRASLAPRSRPSAAGEASAP